ncbi:MAG TPA: glycosyltransferase [Bacteroidia bacterium]|nr:glycosyltransferase [Bacteroidia bacterium]
MPEKLPVVSIVMPCYNAEKYFVEAIESIINQTYKNLEIVLVNDGSTDGTSELLNKYAREVSQIKIISNEKNLGLIASLNKGVAAATGEYIARMDADDISVSDRIEKIMNVFFQIPEVEVVSAANFMISLKGKILLQTVPKATRIKALKFVSFFSTPIVHACVIVKSNVFKENVFNPDYIHSEDYELFSRLIFQGVKMYNLKDPLYYIRINPDSVSFKYEKIQVSTHTKISKQNIENYYNISLEYFVHKVMINRISFDVPVSLLKEAFKQLELLKTIFIQREDCSLGEIDEIELFLIEQKIDIILQSIKYSSLKNKIALSVFMLVHARLFLSTRGSNYVKSKIYSKTKSR